MSSITRILDNLIPKIVIDKNNRVDKSGSNKIIKKLAKP